MGWTRFGSAQMGKAWFGQVDSGPDQVQSRMVGLDLRADDGFGFGSGVRWGFQVGSKVG